MPRRRRCVARSLAAAGAELRRGALDDLNSLRNYRNTGMYLLDFPLLFKIGGDGGVFSQGGEGDIGQLSFPQGGMDGAFAEFGGLGRTAGVAFVQSHDTDSPKRQHL